MQGRRKGKERWGERENAKQKEVRCRNRVLPIEQVNERNGPRTVFCMAKGSLSKEMTFRFD